MRFKRPRQAPLRACFSSLRELAKSLDNAFLALVDNIKPGCQPNENRQANQQACQGSRRAATHRATALLATILAAAFPAEQAVDALIKLLPQLVEVRRTRIVFLAPLGIVPGHVIYSSLRLRERKGNRTGMAGFRTATGH